MVLQSYADSLVALDTDGISNVFRHNRQTGAAELVSLTVADGLADDDSIRPDRAPTRGFSPSSPGCRTM